MRALLLPGLDGTGYRFAELANALAPRIRASPVTYPPDIVLGYEQLAQRIELPAEPFVLVAESFSGPIAINIAALRPANLRGLVLAATFASCPNQLLAFAAPLLHPWLFRATPPPALLRYGLLGNSATATEVAELTAAIASVEPEVLAARLAAVREVNVIREFASLQVPVLYIRARHDAVIALRAYHQLRTLQPDLQHVVLDAPHLVLQQAMRASVDAIVAFVSAL